MTDTIPPLLKPVGRFLQVAKMLDKAQPVIAHYCRLYAVQLGIQLRGKNPDPEAKKFLTALIDQLEAHKSQLEAELARPDRKEQFLLNFAVAAFKHADDEDRAGNATKKTARDFLHATIFFDAYTQFSALPEEYASLSKYAKWKAVQITSALKRGDKPPAGPEGWDPNSADADFEAEGDDSALPAVPTSAPSLQKPSNPNPNSNSNSNPNSNIPTPSFSNIPSTPSLNNSSSPATGPKPNPSFPPSNKTSGPEVPSPTFFSNNIPGLSNIPQTSPPNFPTSTSNQMPSAQMPMFMSPTTSFNPSAQTPSQPGLSPGAQQDIAKVQELQRQQQELAKYQEQMKQQEAQRQADFQRQFDLQRTEEMRKVAEQQSLLQKQKEEMAKMQEMQRQQLLAMQQQMAQQQQHHQQQGKTGPSPAQNFSAAANLGMGGGGISGYKANADEMAKALQQARYVLSALQFEDAPTAIKHLKIALGILTGNPSAAQ